MNFLACFVIYLIGSELIYALVGLWLAGTKKYHCLGIRLIAMGVFTSWACPHLCCLDCDGSCKNCTCPNYHSPRDQEDIAIS